MTPDQLIELKSNPVLRAHLVKFVALECFRNSKLEELHMGKSPRSKTGDYSDVKVVTPYPAKFPGMTCLVSNDDEMKELMIDVVNRCDTYLGAIFVTKKGAEVVETLKGYDSVANWNDPETRLVDCRCRTSSILLIPVDAGVFARDRGFNTEQRLFVRTGAATLEW